MDEAIATPPTAARRTLDRQLDPDLFRALSDPTRLTLLARLAAAPGWLTVTAAASCCGVHLSGVSRHLRALFDAGLLEASREGREVRYRLDCRTLAGRLRGLADALERCAAACGGDDVTCCAEPTGAPAPLDPENQTRHAAGRGEETSR